MKSRGSREQAVQNYYLLIYTGHKLNKYNGSDTNTRK